MGVGMTKIWHPGGVVEVGAQFAQDGTVLNAQVAGVVTTIAGGVIFVAGLARLGFLDSVLSRPFLRGFISAIGFVIFVDQAIPELGLSPLAEEVSHQRDGVTRAAGVVQAL